MFVIYRCVIKVQVKQPKPRHQQVHGSLSYSVQRLTKMSWRRSRDGASQHTLFWHTFFSIFFF